MNKIMRSVERDLRTMSLGLGAINKEIEYWQKKGSTDKSTKKRLERLQAAKPVSYTHLTLPTNREV